MGRKKKNNVAEEDLKGKRGRPAGSKNKTYTFQEAVIDNPEQSNDTIEDLQVGYCQYYWCVNCGHYGNFEQVRQRGLKCQKCNYEHITPLSDEEWKEEVLELRPWFNK